MTSPSLDKNKTNCINPPCGYKTLTGIVKTETGSKTIHTRLLCKLWSCPYCGPRRAWLYQQLITQKAQEFGLDRFMTLTLDPKKIRGNPYEYLKESWRKLREALRRKFGKSISFITVTEAHKSGIPHMHILVDRFIHQGWLSKKWSSLGGGPMVDIRKISDLKNMVRYVGKYLTKDILLSAPKGTRRVTTSQNIKLREKVSEGIWSISDADLETLLEVQKSNAENVVRNKDGRLMSFDIPRPIDLSHFGVPNDRPLIQEGDREKFPEIPDFFELIAKHEIEEQQNETGSDIRESIEQGTAAGRILHLCSIEALGGICQGAGFSGLGGIPGCGDSKAGWPASLWKNAVLLEDVA